jgi:hypothetical protein
METLGLSLIALVGIAALLLQHEHDRNALVITQPPVTRAHLQRSFQQNSYRHPLRWFLEPALF